MIKVGINLLWLRPGLVGGSEQYLTRILAGLARRAESGIDVKLYVLPEFVDAYPDLAEHFSTSAVPLAGATPARRVLSEQRWLPSRLDRDGIDVSFHAGGTMPLSAGPRPIVLVHDVQYLDYPAFFSTVKRRYLALQVPRSVRKAAMVAAPSQFTADRLVEAFGIDPGRTAVVPHGLDRPDGSVEPFATHRPVVLFPAITYPHKNHEVLLRAVATMSEPVDVVLSGGAGPAEDQVMALATELGIAGAVHRLGRVDELTLDRWWATAAVLAWPSRYEVFGAPLLEAMARGVPIVASDQAAVPEVVGDAGEIVGVDDVEGWASALTRALDPARAHELGGRGLQRAQLFTTDRAVDALLGCIDRTHRI